MTEVNRIRRRDVLLAALAPAIVRGAAARRPNILVIVADDLGYADLGFTGCREWETPNLDRLAQSGVRFDAGYVTHPYCSPSRAGLLTGRYQQRFGHEANPDFSPDDDAVGTDPGETFLSDVLRGAGYRTAAIGKWHLGDAPRFVPQRRGFDEFFGFSGGGFDYYGTPRPREPRHRVQRNGQPVPAGELTYLTDDFSREAEAFIRRDPAKPFFLYLAYNAPHAPNQAPQRYLDRVRHIEYGARSVYAAMTIAMDDGVGRVMRALEETGQRENTLVFFLSDNGGRADVADNRPYRGHKGMLYEGGVRVPFAVSWPERLRSGTAYPHAVSSLDIFATAVAAAGLAKSPGRPLDGVDLLPYLTGRTNGPPHETLYWREIGGEGWAVRRGKWKLMRRSATGAIELYDIGADPGERKDLAAVRADVVAELRSLYERWNAGLVPPRWPDAHPQNVRKEYQDVMDARKKALPPARK